MLSSRGLKCCLRTKALSGVATANGALILCLESFFLMVKLARSDVFKAKSFPCDTQCETRVAELGGNPGDLGISS